VRPVALLLALLALAGGCRTSRQSAFEAWQVPTTGIPPYDLQVGTDEREDLFSAQVVAQGWTEEQAKQVAADVIEQRRESYAAIAVRFVSDAGEMVAGYAREQSGANHLRTFGFDPGEVEAHGYPFLGFLRAGPPQPAPEG